MAWYAIKHIPSGGFLPLSPYRRGATWVEPSTEKPPRLFPTRRAAQWSLNQWLMGGQSIKYADDYVHLEKRPERNKDDMMVIQVLITEAA